MLHKAHVMYCERGIDAGKIFRSGNVDAAVVYSPEDEDIVAKREMQDALLNIYYSSKVDPTVLNVTHDISEAVYLSNRVYILKPKPCTIYSVIDIDFGNVRRTPDIRNLEKFSNYVKQIENIMEEINNGGK